MKSISVTNHNYEIAWSLLEGRYFNHREQVFVHIKRFMSLLTAQNEFINDFLNFVDITFECIRSLDFFNH